MPDNPVLKKLLSGVEPATEGVVIGAAGLMLHSFDEAAAEAGRCGTLGGVQKAHFLIV